jgi:hypothetical protein
MNSVRLGNEYWFKTLPASGAKLVLNQNSEFRNLFSGGLKPTYSDATRKYSLMLRYPPVIQKTLLNSDD